MEPEELRNLIRTSEIAMDTYLRNLWSLIRVEPEKWAQHPWGDEGGGFWVVGLFGRQVLWYNDIEEGFNVSRYATFGTIEEYGCNQDELLHTLHALHHQLETSEVASRFGAPQPLGGGTGD